MADRNPVLPHFDRPRIEESTSKLGLQHVSLYTALSHKLFLARNLVHPHFDRLAVEELTSKLGLQHLSLSTALSQDLLPPRLVDLLSFHNSTGSESKN